MNSTKMTKKFLSSYSRFLAGRNSCRWLEYVVIITSTKVTSEPPIMVFPDVHHRKDADRLPICDHLVFNHYYNDLYDGVDNKGIRIKKDSLVEGTWKYQLQSNLRRKWVRIK